MNAGSGAGHGKVILLGEHAVVHGAPAIALGLRRSVRVDVTARADGAPGFPETLRPAVEVACRDAGGLDANAIALTIEGDLPIAVGLGSSAALAVALTRALDDATGRRRGPDETALAANAIERVFHGTPSGIDANTATRGGLLWFEMGPPLRCEPIQTQGPLPLVVALSGTQHATGKTVGGLGERAAASPEVYQPVFRAIGELAASARRALERRAWPSLGALMNMNHELLRACGVSTPELDQVVEEARACGALGAKLTGAGGGGAALALADGPPQELAEALARRGWTTFLAAPPLDDSGNDE